MKFYVGLNISIRKNRVDFLDFIIYGVNHIEDYE